MTTAIKVDHLSKKFSRSLKRAMIYGLRDVARAALIPHRFRSERLSARLADASAIQHPVSSIQHPASGLRPSEFWALRDVSFEVPRGECLGVVGPNGAGKSTLFSVLSGIYGPTSGRVEVRGRLQALIALGAGFHPLLSGRENIYINAAILGLKARQIDRLFDEIVDFAEIRDFIDMPVGHYSSGMFVRLGFSVAVHMKPDVLLVDEVLAVGDLAFRHKSLRKMMALIDSGIPVLFVSHSPPAIEMVSSRVLWLDHGRIRGLGKPSEILGQYVAEVDHLSHDAPEYSPQEKNRLFPIRIARVETLDREGREAAAFGWREDIVVRLHYECAHPVQSPYFIVAFRRPGVGQSDFCVFSMSDDALHWDFRPGQGFIDCRIESPPLAPGSYDVRCCVVRSPTVSLGETDYQEWFVGARFDVAADPAALGRPGLLQSHARYTAPVLLGHSWSRGA